MAIEDVDAAAVGVALLLVTPEENGVPEKKRTISFFIFCF
jgi:hypothetical protein